MNKPWLRQTAPWAGGLCIFVAYNLTEWVWLALPLLFGVVAWLQVWIERRKEHGT